MRVPVYPRGSNPRIARRMLKKSVAFAENEVRHARADWVDPADPRQGIVPREFLASAKVYSSTPDQLEATGPPPDVGLKFIPPTVWKNPTLPRINLSSLVASAPDWDWAMEIASA